MRFTKLISYAFRETTPLQIKPLFTPRQGSNNILKQILHKKRKKNLK